MLTASRELMKERLMRFVRMFAATTAIKKEDDGKGEEDEDVDTSRTNLISMRSSFCGFHR